MSKRSKVHALVPMVVAIAATIGAVLGAAPTAGAAATVRAAVSSAPATGSVGVRLLDVPVDEANDPRARQYIVDELEPGTTVRRRIEVANKAASSLRVDLYSDAASIESGSFVGAAGHSTNDLSSWTSLSQDSLDIAAGARVQDTVTIAIPTDAAPGEQYAVVWAEVSSPSGGDVTLVNRTGIRLYVDVGGKNPPASSFTVGTMTAQRDPNGRPVVQALVHNTGGRALDMSGTLTLSKVSGSLQAGPYPAQLGTTLAPRQSEPVKFVLTDQLDNGPWNATIALQSGLLHRTYAARITFPNGPGSTPPAAAHQKSAISDSTVRNVLIAALGLLLVVLLLAILFIIRRRRVTTSVATR